MCRNIKTLFNFEPPASDDEIRAASLQFVRKLSGFNKPSKANQIAFDEAVEAVTGVATELLDSLGATVEEIDLDDHPDRASVTRAILPGHSTVPLVVIDDKPVGGFQELSALHQRGQLGEMIFGA